MLPFDVRLMECVFMLDLTTTYCGLTLTNPLIVAASTISNHVDRVKQAEECGAAALIIRSLFEEQISFDSQRMADRLAAGGESFAEAVNYFPPIKHSGPKEHLMWVERTRAAVKMPLFASLNAVSPGAWVDYARQLADTGVNGLEVNYYVVATDMQRAGADIEKSLYETVEQVRATVKLPIAVKLSPYYTSIPNVVAELEKRGVQAVAMFNRFLQPDIDPLTETLHNEMVFSMPNEIKIPLRWVALLYGRAKVDLSLTSGVHRGLDAVKALLAGATTVQMAATLLRNGIPYLSTMLLEIQNWMNEHGYTSVNEFRGKMSQKNCDDPFTFERAQYVQLLLDQR
jgi:dihydroorotate dehydrogenase (fumarate)